MESKGFDVVIASGNSDALAKVSGMLPYGSEVMHGHSTTLEEIGFIAELESKQSRWVDVRGRLAQEADPERRADMRRRALACEYFLCGVNAISRTGELVFCDASGSRLGALSYSAKTVIIVAGTNKIAGDLDAALRRVREHAFPLEDRRVFSANGTHSTMSKWLVIENERIPHRITVVLVDGKLGY